MYDYDPRQYRSPQRVWDVEAQAYTDYWITTAPFDITLPDGRKIHVPKDFIYDKASVPRAAWWWLSRDDRHTLIAALVHDYLYDNQKIDGEWIYRKEADEIFYNLLRQSGMRWSKAKAVYTAVRVGGWRWFNHRAKRNGNKLYVDDKD